MNRHLRYLYVFAALVAALSTVAATPTRNYRAHLSGPDTLAQGQTILWFSEDGTELYYKLILANIENVRMAHIHVSTTPGGSGPPVVWLYPDMPPPQPIPGPFQGVLAEGTAMEGDPGVSITFSDLTKAIEENRAYVNVHTDQVPGGEIRGQID